ncbi:hypothetical protein FO519_003642 [Halicephalobus sp. NKZ332]|nr:hypothetical protein FO519_003642 [Halicephalobus sp. NKZ332]
MLKFAVGTWVEGMYGPREDMDMRNINGILSHSIIHDGKPRFASIRQRRRCESVAPSLNPHRRSFIAVGSTPTNTGSQSVVLRNQNSVNGSALSLRVRPSSRNSSILGIDDIPSPAVSSAFSNTTTRSSLILPTNNASSQNHCHSYVQSKEKQRFQSSSPYDSATTTLIGSSSTISNGTEDCPRIWQGPNHTTTMIINDPGSQSGPLAMPVDSGSVALLERRVTDRPPRSTASRKIADSSKPRKPKSTQAENGSKQTTSKSNPACTSGVHHHHRNSLVLTPNGCRKSMVLNGQSVHNGATENPSSNGDKHSVFPSNGKNVYHFSNGISNASDFPVNGTVSRRSMINGSSPYKNNSRLIHSNGKTVNGSTNGSPRSSVTSFNSYNGTSNGFENGSPHERQSPVRQHSNSPTSITSEDSAVVVRMTPDHQGRFGFNVSGGYDRGYPVIVSRVVTGSPADKCHPRLNVGDMVLKINGQDISSWSYDRVVSCIRNIRNSSSYGEIILTIKPNVYRCGEFEDSDQPQAVPEVMHVAETVPWSDKLAQSLLLLKESLDTGKIVRQFEQLYRKKPGMTMNDARTSANINKNRYRDVIPYDTTRVRIERAPSGDYINANHVNMEIPSSGIVNRYIATQGPLAHTTGDFWYMVWEQGCTTIVMLTTLVEKGRIKCHQYWPSRKEPFEFGNLQITNVSEKLESHCHYRELSIRNKNTREERRVTQMQYTSWPDHGVPDNPKHFIDFVAEGIGRTGVLILMETASCLIEANEPVYPLDIVRTMRDQRAMLIQTSDQYTFVCESILRAYQENTIRPLAEYQKCR